MDGPKGPIIWNDIPSNIQAAMTLSQF